MLSGLSFRSAFVFSASSLILYGFPLTFFRLAEANLVPRAILKKLKTSFSSCSCSEKMRWGSSSAEASLSTFSWLYILLCPKISPNVFHKQYDGIIKGWLHCLMAESKRRFLANNILLAWCLVIMQIQFSFTVCGGNTEKRLESQVKLHRIIVNSS